MEHKLIVGIADMKMARDSGMLVTYALGSCIGICLYDPLKKLGAMVHVMLPMRSRITAKIAGGAKMFEVSGGALGNIGQRNIESVHMNLKREGIRLLKEDVGGTVARTLLFDVSTGMGCVRCYGKPELII